MSLYKSELKEVVLDFLSEELYDKNETEVENLVDSLIERLALEFDIVNDDEDVIFEEEEA